jgi:hypothetical protein
MRWRRQPRTIDLPGPKLSHTDMRRLSCGNRLHATVLLLARTACILPPRGSALDMPKPPGRGVLCAGKHWRLWGGGGDANASQQASSASSWGSAWYPGVVAPLAPPTSVSFYRVEPLHKCRGLSTNSDDIRSLLESSEQPASSTAAEEHARQEHERANHMHVLQSEIEEFADNVTLSKKLSRLQQLEVSKLEDIAKDVFGTGARLVPFGSIAAGLGTVNSDVDVALSLGDAWDADMFARGAVGAARLVTREAADSPGLSQGVTLRGRRRERERAQRKKRGWAQNDPVRGERVRILQQLARAVQRRLRQTVDIDLVLGAKVPVMKLTTSSGVEIDCSVQTRVHSGSITCDVLRMLAESDVRIRQLTLVGVLRHRFTGSSRSVNSSDNASVWGGGPSPSLGLCVSLYPSLSPNPTPRSLHLCLSCR